MEKDNAAFTVALNNPTIFSTIIRHIHYDGWHYHQRRHSFKSLNAVNKQCHHLLSMPSIFHQIVTQLAEQSTSHNIIDIAHSMKKMQGYTHPTFQAWLSTCKKQIALEEALFVAAIDNNPQRITELVETEHVNINARDKTGKTALSIAASCGAHHALQELLRHNPDINLATKYGWTPLKKAVNYAQFASTQLLLDAGADPNQEDDEGYTPLMNAYGNPAIIKLLIAKKADVNHQAHHDQTTALIWTAYSDRPKAMKLLLSAGAHDNFTNEDGLRARDIARIHAEDNGYHARAQAQQCLQLLEEKCNKHKIL